MIHLNKNYAIWKPIPFILFAMDVYRYQNSIQSYHRYIVLIHDMYRWYLFVQNIKTRTSFNMCTTTHDYGLVQNSAQESILEWNGWSFLVKTINFFSLVAELGYVDIIIYSLIWTHIFLWKCVFWCSSFQRNIKIIETCFTFVVWKVQHSESCSYLWHFSAETIEKLRLFLFTFALLNKIPKKKSNVRWQIGQKSSMSILRHWDKSPLTVG